MPANQEIKTKAAFEVHDPEMFLAEYIAVFIRDASRALQLTDENCPRYCDQALLALQRGVAGTYHDPIISASAVLLGKEPVDIFKLLLSAVEAAANPTKARGIRDADNPKRRRKQAV